MPDEQDKTPEQLPHFDHEPATGEGDSQSVPSSMETPDVHPTPADTPNDQPPVVPAPAVTAQSAAAAPPQVVEPAKVSPGQLVLQWLTYAFWGWSALAVSLLTAMVVNYFLRVDGWSGVFQEAVAYVLASVLVLFAISLATDIFYTKHEKTHKTGASMVVMVIHAVIFALFGIGWLIAAVFGAVRLLMGDTDSGDGALAQILSSLIIVLVYGFTLVRTLLPFGKASFVRIFWIFMSALVGVLLIAAIAGPAAQARLAKADEAIESGLPSVSRAINDYTERNDALPKSLKDINSSLEGDARTIVQENKVKYQAKERLNTPTLLLPQADQDVPGVESQTWSIGSNTKDSPVYHYVLCVTYASESEYYDENYDSYRDSLGDDNYPTVPSTYRHPSGEVCYDLQTDYNY